MSQQLNFPLVSRTMNETVLPLKRSATGYMRFVRLIEDKQ
jgi:hypothetical protein